MMRINVSKMSPKTFKKPKTRQNMEKKYVSRNHAEKAAVIIGRMHKNPERGAAWRFVGFRR